MADDGAPGTANAGGNADERARALRASRAALRWRTSSDRRASPPARHGRAVARKSSRRSCRRRSCSAPHATGSSPLRSHRRSRARSASPCAGTRARSRPRSSPCSGPSIRKAIAETMAGLVNTINRAIEHSLSPRGHSRGAWRRGAPACRSRRSSCATRSCIASSRCSSCTRETGLLLAHVPEDTSADADLISGMLDGHRRLRERFVRAEADGRAARVRGRRPQRAGRAGPAGATSRRSCVGTAARDAAAEAADDARDDSPPVVATARIVRRRRAPRSRRRGRCSRTASRRCWRRIARAARRASAVRVGGSGRCSSSPPSPGGGPRGARRWNETLTRLETEPGIAVIRSERTGGKWRVTGMRDPLARESALRSRQRRHRHHRRRRALGAVRLDRAGADSRASASRARAAGRRHAVARR